MNCVSFSEQNGSTISWSRGERGIRGEKIENVSSRAVGGVQVSVGESCEHLSFVFGRLVLNLNIRHHDCKYNDFD